MVIVILIFLDWMYTTFYMYVTEVLLLIKKVLSLHDDCMEFFTLDMFRSHTPTDDFYSVENCNYKKIK